MPLPKFALIVVLNQNRIYIMEKYSLKERLG